MQRRHGQNVRLHFESGDGGQALDRLPRRGQSTKRGNDSRLHTFGVSRLERESEELDSHGQPKVFRNSLIGIVEDGNLLRTWGIQRDVTEQVKLEQARAEAETALRKSEEHFRILVEQASDGIFLADPRTLHRCE